MKTRKYPLAFIVSELIHFLAIAALVWVVVVSYMEPRLITKGYMYLFGDVSLWSVPKLIGMHEKVELAYFAIINFVIIVLHLNLAIAFVVNVNLREQWTSSDKSSLSELLNKNLWGLFWPYCSVRVFRSRTHYHNNNELEEVLKKELRAESFVDLPGVILATVFIYPFLYSRLDSGGFLSLFGWQILTLIILMLLWNQVLSWLVLFVSLARNKKEK